MFYYVTLNLKKSNDSQVLKMVQQTVLFFSALTNWGWEMNRSRVCLEYAYFSHYIKWLVQEPSSGDESEQVKQIFDQ